MARIIDQKFRARVPISKLHPWPGNPRRGNLDQIRESIRVNGFYGVVMVQESTGWIVWGNHRTEAARLEGLTHLPVAYAKLTDQEAERMLVADNATADAATWQRDDLATVLGRLASSDLGLIGTGFDDQSYRKLLDELSAEADDPYGRPSTGDVLGLQDVSLGEPTHQVARGDVYQLGPIEHNHLDSGTAIAGPHILAVVPVTSGWPTFVPHLGDGTLFLPYPGPYIPLTSLGLRSKMVLVQPDPYLAGHLLDKWASVFPHAISGGAPKPKGKR